MFLSERFALGYPVRQPSFDEPRISLGHRTVALVSANIPMLSFHVHVARKDGEKRMHHLVGQGGDHIFQGGRCSFRFESIYCDSCAAIIAVPKRVVSCVPVLDP